MKVLVTRPAYVARDLCQKIQDLGDTPELLPTIEIQFTANKNKFHKTIAQLDQADFAVFVSRAAVQFSIPVIKQQWAPLPPIKWAAIGPATAKALQLYQIHPVIVPLEPPFETESLLALDVFQSVKGKKVLIFRGNGGRLLLSQTLKQRGATVKLIECYQRSLPHLDIVERLTNWRHNHIDIIVTTSIECLNNLLLLLGPNHLWVKEIPLIVVGRRMYELANKLEFKYPLLALGADDASIIKVLSTFKDNKG